MNEKIYQKIFDAIQDYLPESWAKVVFMAGYTEGSYNMKFYVSEDGKSFVDCFSLKTCTKAQLIKLFMGIDKAISKERKQLSDKDRWTVMTLSANANGSFKVSFDYENISENFLAYEKDWKKNYLK